MQYLNNQMQHPRAPMDCKNVLDSMHSNEFNFLISRCNTLVNFIPNSKVNFVKRQANRAVHSLEKTSRSYARIHEFEPIPNCIVLPLMNEMKQVCFVKKKKIITFEINK